MPTAVALAPLYDTLKALMAADGTLTALLHPTVGGGPGIYDEGNVPQVAARDVMPYVTIGVGTAITFDTFMTAGWNCTCQIKAVTQGSEADALAIVSAILNLLPKGLVIDVAGYVSSWIEDLIVNPTIITNPGVVTREVPIILRALTT